VIAAVSPLNDEPEIENLPEPMATRTCSPYFAAKSSSMHWGTYHRLRARGLAADRRTIDLFAQYLKRPVRIKRR
jgi:hypothetical protein